MFYGVRLLGKSLRGLLSRPSGLVADAVIRVQDLRSPGPLQRSGRKHLLLVPSSRSRTLSPCVSTLPSPSRRALTALCACLGTCLGRIQGQGIRRLILSRRDTRNILRERRERWRMYGGREAEPDARQYGVHRTRRVSQWVVSCSVCHRILYRSSSVFLPSLVPSVPDLLLRVVESPYD